MAKQTTKSFGHEPVEDTPRQDEAGLRRMASARLLSFCHLTPSDRQILGLGLHDEPDEGDRQMAREYLSHIFDPV